MRKILQIIDTPNWAIEKLCKPIRKYNTKFEIRAIYVHPKDLEQGALDLQKIKKEIEWADILDCQYWRTCSQLLDMLPVMKAKKIMLTHHNEKNLLSADWKNIDLHIAKTRYSETELDKKYTNKVVYIPNSFDHEEFHYIDDPQTLMTVGYVGRIVPWKGLKELARACYELKYPLSIMGKIDKPNYFSEIPIKHRENMTWDFFECTDEQRQDYYRHITVYVGNSGERHEVGPLGLLEAMASGVPVVTTPAGIARDIIVDGENGVIVPYGDYSSLKEGIKNLMENKEVRDSMRKNAWNTVKEYNDERMARQYGKQYLDLWNSNDPLVSVIIPTTIERSEHVATILKLLEDSTYKNIEAIVVWDEEKDLEIPVNHLHYPVTQISTLKEGYNLAMARNLGIIESDGVYLMFCDVRMLPDVDAIEIFVDEILSNEADVKLWLFGDKGGGKKQFVENFSFTKREYLVYGGGFNERIKEYGGMSQEIRGRYRRQGMQFAFISRAKAKEMKSSRMTSERRDSVIKMKNLLWKLGLQ